MINSKSVWKSHALYLLAEFFYSKNEKQKSKEFFNQIIILENSNKDLRIKAQRRLNRDLLERDRKMDEVNKRFNKSWYLYYNNLKNYIRSNKVIYINTIDSNNYEQLIRKLKYLY